MAALFAVTALACAFMEGAQATTLLAAPTLRPVTSPSPTSIDFGSVQVGSSSDPVTVTVTNSGVGILSFWRFGIASSSVDPGSFWVVPGGTCVVSAALATGESCTVLVRFRPSAAGARSGLLSFWDNTAAGRINVPLSGTAVPPPASSASPSGVDFGPVQVGSSSDPVTVTLTNTGGGSLQFWRFGIASSSVHANDFRVVDGGTCALSLALASGESCTVLVRFRPTSTGARSGLLSFWDNTPAARINVSLTGTALAAPESSASPASVDFGPVQVGSASDPSEVTVTNTGAGSLSFWRFGIASSSADPGAFRVVSGGSCALSVPLASGESCTVLVRFKPGDAGDRSALLSFWDNTPAGRIDVPLRGTALAGPQSSASAPSVDFGWVLFGLSSDPVPVTVTNTGAGTLLYWRFGIASSSVDAADFWVVPGGTCALSVALASGESCTVLVRFQPTALGDRSGLLSFWDNTLAGRIDVALGGTGFDDLCALGCF